MPTSTSIHSLNHDRGLNCGQKAMYLVANGVNNAFPFTHLDPHLRIRNFRPHFTDEVWNSLPATSSPSRRLSDLFWIHIQWDIIQSLLGNINVLDVGCRSGKYGHHLLEWSHNRIARYTGIDTDVHPEWSSLTQRYPFFTLRVGNAHTINTVIPPGTNFIMSQSVIEHVDHDLLLFQHLSHYVENCDHPVIQVHIFPSAICLPLYLLHGIRQYTPRTISKITSLFQKDSRCELYQLGGKKCNQLHWRYITWPGLLRRPDRRTKNAEQYSQQLRSAIDSDLRRRSRYPSFYALVIYSQLDNFNLIDTIKSSSN